jgi:glycylpeptide N-tetradecanoyltransferase
MNINYPKSYEQAIKLENKFWSTQPVPTINENNYICGPYIECINTTNNEPIKLHDDFVWDLLDLDDDTVCQELVDFLNKHNSNVITNTTPNTNYMVLYTTGFLKWLFYASSSSSSNICLGVRVKKNNLLCGFIGGTVVTNNLKSKVVKTGEVNIICVHHKLRNKRLSVQLIKEITRLFNLKQCYQGVFVTERYVPKPICSAQSYHRAIDIVHLVNCGFSKLDPNIKLDEIDKTLTLPDTTHNKNFMPLSYDDIDDTYNLLNKYLEKYCYYPVFSRDYFEHLFYNNSYVTTYVLKDNTNNKIIDMISYYTLPFNVVDKNNNSTGLQINTAYLFYYTSLFETPYRLIKDMLIVAKTNNIQLFTALNIMETDSVMHDLHFEKGIKSYHYNMYNWKCPTLLPSQIAKIIL